MCLACAKVIIDQANRVEADVDRRLATLRQVRGCALASVMLAPDTAVDEEMEEIVLRAGDRYLAAIKEATEAYAVVLTGLEREARKKWPNKEGEKYEQKLSKRDERRPTRDDDHKPSRKEKE